MTRPDPGGRREERGENGDEPMRSACLTEEELALLAEALLEGAEREEAALHLELCADCRRRWSAVDAAVGSEEEPAAPHAVDAEGIAEAASRAFAPRRFRLRPLAWSAAAASVALALSLPLLLKSGGRTRTSVLPEGRLITGVGETVQAAGSAGEALRLPDGSRLRAAPGAVVRFLPPAEGDRFRIELVRGRLEAEVEPAKGLFRIVGDAGEIRVRGTRFTARSLRIYPPGSPKGEPVLSVEVSEGAVELAGAAQAIRVGPARRGIVRGRWSAPLLQEMEASDWMEAARRWGGEIHAKGFASSWTCATLLGGSWKGLDSWWDALDDARAPLPARRLAAELVSLSADPEEAEDLIARFQRVKDGAVRAALLPGIARMDKDLAQRELLAIGESDTDEKVRSRALELLRGIR